MLKVVPTFKDEGNRGNANGCLAAVTEGVGDAVGLAEGDEAGGAVGVALAEAGGAVGVALAEAVTDGDGVGVGLWLEAGGVTDGDGVGVGLWLEAGGVTGGAGGGGGGAELLANEAENQAEGVPNCKYVAPPKYR